MNILFGIAMNFTAMNRGGTEAADVFIYFNPHNANECGGETL
jgi:hypothetical protein